VRRHTVPTTKYNACGSRAPLTVKECSHVSDAIYHPADHVAAGVFRVSRCRGANPPADHHRRDLSDRAHSQALALDRSRRYRLRCRRALYVSLPLQRHVCLEPLDSKSKTPPIGAGLQIQLEWKGDLNDHSGAVRFPDTNQDETDQAEDRNRSLAESREIGRRHLPASPAPIITDLNAVLNALPQVGAGGGTRGPRFFVGVHRRGNPFVFRIQPAKNPSQPGGHSGAANEHG